jgi:hypothetical protein
MLVDHNRLRKPRSAMDDPMPYGVNGPFIQHIQHPIRRLAVALQGGVGLPARVARVRSFSYDHSGFWADAAHGTSENGPQLGRGCAIRSAFADLEEAELQGRASAVQYENRHPVFRSRVHEG